MTEAARLVAPVGRSPGKKTECVGYGDVRDMDEAGEADCETEVVASGVLDVWADEIVA